MAAFIAKQMIGSKLDSVKDLAGDKKEGGEGGEGTAATAEEEAELLEQRREEEEKRRQKYAKMEVEREKVRQGIRDKYKIEKKKEEAPPLTLADMEGGLNRQRKAPCAISTEEEEFNPVKMATDFFGNVKTTVTNFKFPWSS